MPIRSDGEETRSRILRTAGEEFGLRGFHCVTNQDISAKSGANSAAISYYFRDKAGLYREVWSFLQARSAEVHAFWLMQNGIETFDGVPYGDLKERFVCLAGSLLDWMLDRESWDSAIMAYEREASSGLLDVEHDAVCYPLKNELRRVLAAACFVPEVDPSVKLKVDMIEAGLRTCCRKAQEWEIGWDRDSLFDLAFAPWMAVFPQENRNDEDDAPMGRKKSGRRTTSLRLDDPQMELGVTDEVDPFELKPVTLEDLSHMARLQEAARQKEKEEKMAEDSPPPVRKGEEYPFFQSELF